MKIIAKSFEISKFTNSYFRNLPPTTDIKERCFKFGVEIIKMVESLPGNTAGYAIGNQVIRSGTAVGAILEEASSSLSYNDFVKLLRTARKEAKETLYWLRMIKVSIELPNNIVDPLVKECDELTRILTKSITTSEGRQGDHRIKRHKQ